jgi:hypothetical protein
MADGSNDTPRYSAHEFGRDRCRFPAEASEEATVGRVRENVTRRKERGAADGG